MKAFQKYSLEFLPLTQQSSPIVTINVFKKNGNGTAAENRFKGLSERH